MPPPETPEERRAAINARLEREHEEELHRKWLWGKLVRIGKWLAIAAGVLSLGQDMLDRIMRFWH